MTQVLEPKMNPISNFTTVHRNTATPGQPWLETLRKNGLNRFEEVGFPTRKQEAWRWTNIQPIIKTQFEPAGDANADQINALFDKFTFSHDAVSEIVLVDGVFDSHLSKLGKLPAGVKVMSLDQALKTESALLSRHLGKHADIQKNPFVALNTGLIRDGALIYLPTGAHIEAPIHILLISTGGDKPTVSHPRVLVIAEDKVEATIVESYVGADQIYLTNAVTEIVTGQDCRIDHCRLQQESIRAFHVSTMQVELGRSTNFVSHACTVGGRITRNDLNCIMNGEYAYATLNGLVLIDGDQHCDNHTLLHHEKPNCPSHELYKHVLDGKATGVFKGQIFVQKDAQKTDSKQNSKSLLLSDDAYMNSQPALEIYADDVKCTHGSTTGPVDDDMVFYLRTRGISLQAAKHLLTYAFAADLTRRIKVAPVRTRIEDYMAAKHGLPQDIRIANLGAHDDIVIEYSPSRALLNCNAV